MEKNNPTYKLINKLMQKYNGNVIIDNGCDNNEFKEMYNKSIIGFEVNPKAKADVHTDGKSLPLFNKTVDLFLSNFVLEHVDDSRGYLGEMRRCLKTNGKIIISVPRPIWYLSYYISPFTYWTILTNLKGFIKRPMDYLVHGNISIKWDEKSHEKLFKESGFKVIEKIRSCNFLSLDKHYAKIFANVKMPEYLLTHVTYVLEKK